ncbi:uridine kinase family protein [Blastococcus deserti]|uniref:Uridine kinase n=1 Tax=Blastococcus deserti TaxID=2259033 RepID=A0ABW4X9C3_9ACTN
MTLPREEPGVGSWRVEPIDAVIRLVAAHPGQPSRPRVVAVDGRSASGKTTVAGRVAALVRRSVVLHTDDVAWHHSFFDWADLLRVGVLEPARQGRRVRYRPPAWDERGRPGSIDVPSGCPLVLVEGVGIARRDLRDLVDAVIWVQCDIELAERRGIDRDGGDSQAADLWAEWAAEERPFLADERPWERADVIVAGSPVLPHDPDTELVVATGPLLP